MHLLPLLFLTVVVSSSLSAQTAADSLTRVEKLVAEGNHREAADAGKAALARPDATGELLEATTQALGQLGSHEEQEQVIESAVQSHPANWNLLYHAGRACAALPHSGMMLDGRFFRGPIRDWNSRRTTELKDRVRSLQLFSAAWKLLPADASAADKKDVLSALGQALGSEARASSQAWALLHLTDLSTLPDFDEQSGLDEPAQGYPVNAEGSPVFFKAPESWDKAQNDGERLLWTLEEMARLGPAETREARQSMAGLAKGWFSVQTLAHHGFRFDVGEDDAGRKSSIATLHTLKDDETVAQLATGPKRFKLPFEADFLRLYRMLADDDGAEVNTRVTAWQEVADELLNRRQFPRAAEALQKAVELSRDAEQKKEFKARLDLITGNWGRFEPQAPFAAPKKEEAAAPPAAPSLQLVFRNARKVSFTARKVDVSKLLADTEAYLRTEPQEQQWQRTNLGSIGQRLLESSGGQYLGKPVAEWSQDLEPRTNHWDRRVQVPVPVRDAGAYLIEASFEGGSKARALVWLEGLVLVKTPQPDGLQYFVADALTGAPVPGAQVRFFGFQIQWGRPGLLNRERNIYKFKDFQATSDKHGVVKVKDRSFSEYQWLIRASTDDGRLAFQGFDSFHFNDDRERFSDQHRLYAITDRPVYRPGQEVKWKAWARIVGYDPRLDTNKFAGASIKVTLHDPRGEKQLEKTFKADENGAISDSLPLAEEAVLGQYQMQLVWSRPARDDVYLGSHSFRVEEYKKPEFEVKVEAPDKPVALGDSFEVKVKADYYFGGPVKQGRLKYQVRRSAHTDRWFPMGRWDWLFGSGYGWRASYYDWYPGARSWCFCIPRWPWMQWRNDPPELVAEGEAALNADGTFSVKIDTSLALELHGSEDHRYEIEAEVTDSSRRTLFGKGSVLAARRPFEVYVSMDRGWYNAGDSGIASIHARTLDGRDVRATGELVLHRITYGRDGKPAEEAVIRLPHKDETKPHKITLARGGQYRLAARLKDDAGHEVEGTTFFTVRGAGFEDGREFRFDDLELITEKEEYAPGEDVEVTINTNQAGSTVALFVRAQNGVYPDPVWLRMDGKSSTHRFRLTAADQPNLFIEAFTVREARVHRVTRQIIVPPRKRIATVELLPDAETYLPGQESKVRVRVKDAEGRPFSGQVVLTAYDKALEYISGGSNQADIRPFFWGWKRSHHPRMEDSLREVETGMLKEGERPMQQLGAFGGDVADQEERTAFGAAVGSGAGKVAMLKRYASPMAMAAPAPAPAAAPADAMSALAIEAAAGGGGQAEGPQPMIRTHLADSAVWVADFATDARGEGELNFKLPENLTTWKLRSWVMGPQAQVGEAAVEVVTRKNLMVRLQAPRFFVEKDEVVISANLHNEMEVEQQVQAVLDLEGGVLELTPKQAREKARNIPAHSEHRFDWRVKVTGEGEARIRVKALAAADSDAMEMTFPAYTHGMLKSDSWSLSLRPDQAAGRLTVKVPAERKAEQTRLEIRYSPTLAMALVDALPYLVDYPYGCTEQTLNRFVPTVITLNVLKDLGVDLQAVREKRTNLNAQEIGKADERARRWQGKGGHGRPKEAVFDEDEVMKMARAGLKKLEAMRGGDGGWGWFPGGGESSPHITALVLHGLKAAEKAGMDLNDGHVRNGIEFLSRHEAAQLRRLRLPEKARDHKSAPDQLDALVHCTLVEHGAGDKAMRSQLYEKRGHLSRYNVALLGLACHAMNEAERRDMCLRNLRQLLKQDDENQTAWLDVPQQGWWFWWDDAIETQAAFLKLLSVTEPRGETAARIAKHLLNNRRNGTWWNSTKDTAAVIEALAGFVKASGESEPRQTVELLLDGRSLSKVEISRENLFTFNGTQVLKGEALGTGEHTIELRKLGTSPLYAKAFLTVFTQEDNIPAAGLEVKARRKFYRLIEEKPQQQVAGSRGQVLPQTGSKYRREEIDSDAPVKSGDLIEVELSIESKNDYEYVLIEDLKPAGFEPVDVRSGWSQEGLPSYQEYRDEKVAFFAERLPQGTHNLRYRVKAEIPGRFSALPTRIEAMYAPELKGNSSEWKAMITE
jgi:uncharacterized protein YfaS (alpha-2-macroglobulin family)